MIRKYRPGFRESHFFAAVSAAVVYAGLSIKTLGGNVLYIAILVGMVPLLGFLGQRIYERGQLGTIQNKRLRATTVCAGVFFAALAFYAVMIPIF
jgi:hypothetical protein